MSDDFKKFLLVFLLTGLGMAGIYYGFPGVDGAGRVGMAFLGGSLILAGGLYWGISMKSKISQKPLARRTGPKPPHPARKSGPSDDSRNEISPEASLQEAASQFFARVMQDDVGRMRSLLEAFPGLLNYRNPECEFQSPLLIAVAQDRLRAARFLLEGKADPDIVEPRQGATPLHWASYLGNSAAVSLLLSHGASLEARELAGQTPLHWASRKNRVDAVRALLNAGADINAIDNRGASALMYAIEHNAVAAVEILLASGARTDIVDIFSGSAAKLAEKNPAIQALLKRFE